MGELRRHAKEVESGRSWEDIVSLDRSRLAGATGIQRRFQSQ